jgi:hypothetical protein
LNARDAEKLNEVRIDFYRVLDSGKETARKGPKDCEALGPTTVPEKALKGRSLSTQPGYMPMELLKAALTVSIAWKRESVRKP